MIRGLLCLEVSHKSAPLAVRERLAPHRDTLPALLQRSRCSAAECVILSTCSRFELYALIPEGNRRAIVATLGALAGVRCAGSDSAVRRRLGRDTVLHLLRVAAGLESPILGEDHVLGQVRGSFQLATEVGAVGPTLSALFRAAICAGKRVRHETNLGLTARSYARLALEQFDFADLSTRRVMVVGTGKLAREVADRLIAAGVGGIIFTSTHAGRTAELARRFGGGACAIDALRRRIPDVDAVIACTWSARHLITVNMLRCLSHPLTIVDLGMPRNVAPAAAHLPNVRLKHLDELITDHDGQRAAVEDAERVVREERDRFLRWLRARRIAPLIARLRARADELEPGEARQAKRLLHARIRRFQEGAAA